MSKISLTNLVNLQNETTAVNAINNNNAAITTAMDNTLSRDGTSPNTMGAPIDMNSQRVLNLPKALTADEPLRLQELNDFIGGGTVTNIPSGGLTGQPLVKNSNTNYDVKWGDESADLVAGSNIVLTGTTPTTVSTTLTPTFTSTNITGLTATQSVQTDGSKNLVSVANTGSGSNVLATSPSITSPTLVTPVLGTPSSGTLTSCTGLPISTGVSGLAAGVSAFLATPSSANLATALTDETGSGAAVFATSPALVTPVLGTPTSGTLTNCTGLPIAGITGLGTGVGTALAAVVTGSSGIVLTTSPTITTPAIVGRTNAGNASAGNVGEFVTSSVASASAVTLSTGVTSNVTSISLTAGDWDVHAGAMFTPGATTNATFLDSGISTTTATLPTVDGLTVTQWSNSAGQVLGSTSLGIPTNFARINVSGTTTVFLVAQATFTVSTMKAFGTISARRVQS